MSVYCGRKMESAEITHADSEKLCMLHTASPTASLQVLTPRMRTYVVQLSLSLHQWTSTDGTGLFLLYIESPEGEIPHLFQVLKKCIPKISPYPKPMTHFTVMQWNLVSVNSLCIHLCSLCLWMFVGFFFFF